MANIRKKRQPKRKLAFEIIDSDEEATIDKVELRRRAKKDKQRIRDHVEMLERRKRLYRDSTPDSTPVSASAVLSYANYTQYDRQVYDDVPKPSRNDYWRDQSKVLIACFSKGHNIHGHDDPCLKFPVLVGKKSADCDCEVRTTSGYIAEFMMFESLLMSQMLPTSTKQPKSAVHFSVFESLNDNRLNACSSINGFTKANNATNLRLSNYDVDFKPLPSNFNEMAVIYATYATPTQPMQHTLDIR